MEDFVWHNMCCLIGECLNKGVDMFMTCLAEENKHLNPKPSLYVVEVL
jgi:hypothetical protein